MYHPPGIDFQGFQVSSDMLTTGGCSNVGIFKFVERFVGFQRTMNLHIFSRLWDSELKVHRQIRVRHFQVWRTLWLNWTLETFWILVSLEHQSNPTPSAYKHWKASSSKFQLQCWSCTWVCMCTCRLNLTWTTANIWILSGTFKCWLAVQHSLASAQFQHLNLPRWLSKVQDWHQCCLWNTTYALYIKLQNSGDSELGSWQQRNLVRFLIGIIWLQDPKQGTSDCWQQQSGLGPILRFKSPIAIGHL